MDDDDRALWSVGAIRSAVEAALAEVAAVAAERTGPYSGASPVELAALVGGLDLLPEEGVGLAAALGTLGRASLRHSVDVADQATAGHLHCAPLAPAVAGDLLAAITNQSLDSWDQAPIATHLEREAIARLAALAGFDPDRADGVFTSGGTQSNLTGLLLARDAAARRAGRDAGADGLGPDADRWRILCSADAHFTVQRSAALLGLGRNAVVAVPTDPAGRLDVAALDRALAASDAAGELPIALVATAGTTDLGAIDPLPACAERAAARGLWLHVDAAVAGALLVSDTHADRLTGLAAADSVSVDFHKLLWQPVACGAVLVRDRDTLAPLDVEVAYLNANDAAPADDWRMPHLVDRSLATTRRFDALKLLLTWQALGRRELGRLVDAALERTTTFGELVAAEPALELAAPPSLATVVFRYLPRVDDPARADRVNATIRLRLLADGAAVVGRTAVAGRVYLKCTLLDPTTTRAELADLVRRVVDAGRAGDEER